MITITIVTYNSAATIGACLRSVVAQGGPPDVEVIVVDNASSDATSIHIEAEFPEVKVLRNETNRGFGVAINQASQLAGGDCLLFLNPDVELKPRALRAMVKYINSHPKAGVVGCTLVDGAGVLQRSSWRDMTLLTLLCETFLPYRASLRFVTVPGVPETPLAMVSGACMLVRRDLFRSLGGFDERFFLFYEDADFCLRVRNAGYQVQYCGEAIAIHAGGMSSQNRREFFEEIYASRQAYIEKHFRGVRRLTGTALVLIGILLRIPAYLLVGAVLLDRAHLRLAGWHGAAFLRLIRRR